tara:strand:+ start:643 stop:921 length:279 start_codon:yes stop_codon:yes gene_type:complete
MTHTFDTTLNLDNILDYVHSIIDTHAEYAQLPQEIRDLYEEAQEIEWNRQMEWNEKCAREDEEEAKRKEEARLRAIWDAVDNGSSSSPNGSW